MAQRGLLASVVLVASAWMSQVRARVAGLGFPEREMQKGAQREASGRGQSV
jgi:hypothetical protein